MKDDEETIEEEEEAMGEVDHKTELDALQNEGILNFILYWIFSFLFLFGIV